MLVFYTNSLLVLGLPVRDASQYVNMQQLYDWSVFEKLNAISEVSGQASGEAALEKMIKNVSKYSCSCCCITKRFCLLRSRLVSLNNQTILTNTV